MMRMDDSGEVPEWSIGPVSKTGVPSRVPWVRIPPSPPLSRPQGLLLTSGIDENSWENGS